MLDTDGEQCNTEVDCAKRGGAFANAACVNRVCVARPPDPMSDAGDASEASSDPVWGCLGHVVMGTPQSATVKVSVPFWDLIRMVPINDVAMRTCTKLDVTCSRPTQSAVPADSDGIVMLDVPALFDGYGQVFSLNNADSGEVDASGDAGDVGDAASEAGDANGVPSKYVPSLVFFNPPLVRDTTYNRVPLFVPNDIKVLAAVQGNSWDEQHFGMAFVGALDCAGKPAAGVAWEPSITDAMTKRFYYFNGLPDEAAVSTDSTGFAGLLNAPPGTITFTARVQATGQKIGSATMLVRAGVASYTYLAPVP